jgi:hypothetical protein
MTKQRWFYFVIPGALLLLIGEKITWGWSGAAKFTTPEPL